MSDLTPDPRLGLQQEHFRRNKDGAEPERIESEPISVMGLAVFVAFIVVMIYVLLGLFPDGVTP